MYLDPRGKRVSDRARLAWIRSLDNGDLDRPIEEIDIIDLAAAEVGIAFENEMLRRQLSNKRS